MDGMWCYLLFALGLVIIIKASDFFVDSAIWVARASHIPEIIIGATLVSLCTTLPETFISAASSLHDMPEMAFGNAFGSIACNTAFILGLTVFLSKPPIHNRRNTARNLIILVLLIAGMGFFLLYSGGLIPHWLGLILLGLLLVYLVGNVRSARRGCNSHAVERVDTSRHAVIQNVLFLALGAFGVVIGSDLLVENGERIARSLGVSEMIIGLTITAFGSSLPELVTSITAMLKKAHNLSIGNIIGADILNILLVTGLASTIEAIHIDLESALFTIAFDFVIAMILLTFILSNKRCLHRSNGLLMLLLYGGYITVNILFFAR